MTPNLTADIGDGLVNQDGLEEWRVGGLDIKLRFKSDLGIV